MRLKELLTDQLGAGASVVDATGVDLGAEVPGPARRVSRFDLGGLPLNSTDVVLLLIGPNEPLHTGPSELSRLLKPAHRAVVLVGWPFEALPASAVLEALDQADARLVSAVELESSPVAGVEIAMVVRRGADRSATEQVLRELLTARIGSLTSSNDQLRRSLTRAKAATTTLQRSTAMGVGRAILDGVRKPVRGVVSVPADLLRVYRARARARTRRHPSPTSTQVLPLTLPPDAMRKQITLTSPRGLLVPSKLAETGLGGYEPSALACYLALIDVAGPGAVFDIGSNVGIYAAIGAAVSKRSVVAFEPTPSLVAVSRAFSVDNGLDFITEEIALGAENGTATFYLSDVTDSSNSLAKGYRLSTKQIEVAVETLDSYVRRSGHVPAVMKVDTETTEPQVLAGGAETIAKYRPWILCEVLAGRVEAQLEKVLAPHRYRWYPVELKAPYREAVRIVGDPTYENLMWLFAPEPPADEFWGALERRLDQLRSSASSRPNAQSRG